MRWSPLSHNLLDSKINTVLSMCQDTNLLNPVHGIVQSVVYHEESPPQYQPSYLQSNRPLPVKTRARLSPRRSNTFASLSQVSASTVCGGSPGRSRRYRRRPPTRPDETRQALTRFLSFQQTQIPDYAELIVKFLEALVDSYLPAAEEERGEEQLRTPTSPYPPTSQSQLSITANLNLSNSMTSLATSQHSPGRRRGLSGNAPFCAVAALRFGFFLLLLYFFVCPPGVDKENVQLSPSSALSSGGRTRHGSASQVQKQRSTGSFKRPSIKKIV